MSFSLYVLAVGAIVLALLALLSVGRLFLGPTTADRLIALDTINTFVVGLMILIAAISDSIIMVDAAIVYGALSFVGRLFFVRLLEGGM
jgi:multicomponent Na+:H+ antiporter subunit F